MEKVKYTYEKALHCDRIVATGHQLGMDPKMIIALMAERHEGTMKIMTDYVANHSPHQISIPGPKPPHVKVNEVDGKAVTRTYENANLNWLTPDEALAELRRVDTVDAVVLVDWRDPTADDVYSDLKTILLQPDGFGNFLYLSDADEDGYNKLYRWCPEVYERIVILVQDIKV